MPAFVRLAAAFPLVLVTLAVAQEGRGEFEPLVPHAALDSALRSLDPRALVEVCEKIAAAEKRLNQKYPVPLGGLLKTTLRAASLKRDAAALDRLARLAGELGNDEVALAATLAKSGARGPSEDAFMVALDAMPADDVARVRGWMNQIYTASAMANREDLLEMQKRVEGLTELDPRIVAQLKKRLAAALEKVGDVDVEEKFVGETRKGLTKKDSTEEPLTKKEAKKKDSKKAEPKREEPEDEPKKSEDEPKKSGEKRTPPKNIAEAIEALADGPDALLDEGFEGKVDFAKLGKHFKAQDAEKLADIAIRLAKEEEVLGRKHNFIPSSMILRTAVGFAIAREDDKTLARIEAELKKLRGEKSEEYTRFVAQRQLASASRKGNKPLMVSLDQLAEGPYETYRYGLDLIDGARKSQDLNTLRAFKAGLPGADGLSPEQRKNLDERLGDALSRLPEAADESLEMLRLLGESASRGESALPLLNLRLNFYSLSRLDKPATDGKSSTFVREGLKSLPAKFPATDSADWGKKVAIRDAVVGDVVRYLPPKGKGYEFGVVKQVIAAGGPASLYTVVTPPGGKAAKGALTVVDLGKAKEAAVFRPQAK